MGGRLESAVGGLKPVQNSRPLAPRSYPSTSIVDRIFYVAVGIQLVDFVLGWFVSSDSWVHEVAFAVWAGSIPIMGFMYGRSGGGPWSVGRKAALLALIWFYLPAVVQAISRSRMPADMELIGWAGLAFGCAFLAGTLFVVASAFSFVGRLFRPRTASQPPATGGRPEAVSRDT